MRPRRGLSNVLLTALALSTVVLGAFALILHGYTTGGKRGASVLNHMDVDDRVRYVELDVVAVTSASRGSLDLVVSNRGGKEVVIEGVYALVSCGDGGAMVKLATPREVLRPGASYQLSSSIKELPQCPGSIASVSGVYVVTSEPRVHSAKLYDVELVLSLPGLENSTNGLNAPIARSHVLLPVRASESPWNVLDLLSSSGFALAIPDNNATPSRLTIISDRSILQTGVRTASGRWVLRDVFTNVPLSLSNAEVRNVFLGYDPSNASRYVLLITSDRSIAATIGGTQRTLCSNSPAVRIKVYGFTNATREGIVYVTGDTSRFGSGKWVVRPDQDVAEYTFIGGTSRGRVSMSGRASRVEVYCFETGSARETSYDPYLLAMGSTSNPTLASVLFTTIDAVYGFANTENDRPGSTAPALQDRSRVPLVLVYRKVAIDNSNTRSVLLALNYRFHDNEGNDFSGVTVDAPIVILGLVDEEGKVLSYRSLTFRELTRYEDTYPPTAQAQSVLVFIPVPPVESVGPRKFFVFLMIQDPYLNNGTRDDVDITLYIESLVVLLYE